MKAVGGDEAIRDHRPIQAAMIGILLVVATAILVNSSAAALVRTPIKLAVLGLGLGLLGFALEDDIPPSN